MAKKSFKETISPAMSFISQESIDRAEEEAPAAPEEITAASQRPAKPPKGYKLNPLYIETKSERLQLLVPPSLKAKLKERAKREGTSLNELVNNILSDALKEE